LVMRFMAPAVLVADDMLAGRQSRGMVFKDQDCGEL
jgi:hypothetical protein